MDAEMLKVICEGYETRIRLLTNDLDGERELRHKAEMEAICLKRGGHEFEQKGEHMCKYEECKFCGFVEDNT